MKNDHVLFVERRMRQMATDHEQMRIEMDRLIEALELPELNKQFLQARWLEQVIWMEGKAHDAVRWYYMLRLTTIVGGVIVPALVSQNLQLITFIVSLLVAMSAAVEEFFHYGERWRHYRRTAELLKSEGWQYFQLSGDYGGQSHSQAYPTFAARVEELSREEVMVYMTQVVRDKKDKADKTNSPAAQ